MNPFRWNIPWRPLRRRLTAGLALVAYLAAAAGVPLPVSPRKDCSQPFPCQNNPCGCRTAEQCWRSCCCYTPEEHWAWARAHHVEPPAYAEKPATPDRHTAHACSRCSPAAKSCCHDDTEHAACCHEDGGGSVSRPAARGGWRVVLGVNVLRCRGLSTLWVTSGSALPPEPPLAWAPWPVPAGWLSDLDPFPAVLSRTPPEPPPRSPCA